MCGFAGFLGGAALFGGGRAAPVASAMAGCIRHRGPDHGGLRLGPEAGVPFALRRLTIVDLSPANEQPMETRSGRYVTIYNGEIYNHLDRDRDRGLGGHQQERQIGTHRPQLLDDAGAVGTGQPMV